MKKETMIESEAYQLACEISYGVANADMGILDLEKRFVNFAHAILKAAGVKITDVMD